MATPERELWPFTPRPPVLPEPEPMPRPTRLRDLVAPSLSRSSLSFILSLLARRSGLVHDADEMLDAGDHAAHGRGVLERAAAMQLVETEADQRRALLGRAADRATDLLDRDGLSCRLLGHGLCSRRLFFGRDGSAAARLQGRILDTALGSHVLGMELALQRIEGGAHHVVGVRGTHRLGDDVLHAERLEDGAHRAARDDAGAGPGGAQQNLARAPAAM